MTGGAWPMRCGNTTCAAKIKEAGEAFAVWKCRQDHYFAVCTVECQRQFDKRCGKVFDTIERLERKLCNDSHSNPLRRLGLPEREKLKQKDEAAKNRLLVCPFDAKVSEKCVPHCCQCMSRCGGSPQQEDLRGAPPPPPRQAKSPKSPETATPLSSILVADDMLVVHKKDGGSGEEEETKITAAPKTKGKPKKTKNRRGQVLLLDFEQYKQAELDGEAEAAGLLPGKLTSPAWSGTLSDSKSPTDTISPQQQRLIDKLVDTTGCSQKEAKELLEVTAWQLQRACEAYLDQPADDGSSMGDSRNGTPLATRVRPNITPASPATASPKPAAAAAAGTPARAKAASAATGQRSPAPQVAASSPVPATSVAEPPPSPCITVPPAQPPPPCLPRNWSAVWCQEHGAYYFWHHPTDNVVWEMPSDEDEEAANEAKRKAAEAEEEAARLAEIRAAQERAARAEAERVARIEAERVARAEAEARELAARVEAERVAKAEAERAAAAERKAAAERAAAEARAAAAEEARKRAEAARLEAERVEAARRAEEQRRAEQESEQLGRKHKDLVTEVTTITGVAEARCRAVLEANAWDLAVAIKIIAEEQLTAEAKRKQEEEQAKRRNKQTPETPADGGAEVVELVCTRHWRPLGTVENTMRLFHGERVRVHWSDGSWAWGHTLENQTKFAYFPRDILAPLRRPPRRRLKGETCSAAEPFEAPTEILGYISVAKGDIVRLLHPIEEPLVWAFAQRLSAGGPPDSGWLPESILVDLDAHPAG